MFTPVSGGRRHQLGPNSEFPKGRPVAGPAGFVDNDFLGESNVRSTFADEDYTLGFDVRVPFPGGTLQPAGLQTNPILAALTTGFGFAVYNFDACGVVFPHVHPRGDESVYVVSGTIDVGFVDEAGELVRNPELAENTGFVIPQGAAPLCKRDRTRAAPCGAAPAM